jgi:hypothetical protein
MDRTLFVSLTEFTIEQVQPLSLLTSLTSDLEVLDSTMGFFSSGELFHDIYGLGVSVFVFFFSEEALYSAVHS